MRYVSNYHKLEYIFNIYYSLYSLIVGQLTLIILVELKIIRTICHHPGSRNGRNIKKALINVFSGRPNIPAFFKAESFICSSIPGVRNCFLL